VKIHPLTLTLSPRRVERGIIFMGGGDQKTVMMVYESIILDSIKRLKPNVISFAAFAYYLIKKGVCPCSF